MSNAKFNVHVFVAQRNVEVLRRMARISGGRERSVEELLGNVLSAHVEEKAGDWRGQLLEAAPVRQGAEL